MVQLEGSIRCVGIRQGVRRRDTPHGSSRRQDHKLEEASSSVAPARPSPSASTPTKRKRG